MIFPSVFFFVRPIFISFSFHPFFVFPNASLRSFFLVHVLFRFIKIIFSFFLVYVLFHFCPSFSHPIFVHFCFGACLSRFIFVKFLFVSVCPDPVFLLSCCRVIVQFLLSPGSFLRRFSLVLFASLVYC